MGRAGKQRNVDRREVLERVKAQQRRDERRRMFWIYGGGSIFLLALIVTVVTVFVVDAQNRAATVAAASKPIDGVQSFTGLTQNHTSNPVNYPQNPPVGGDHAAQWINCGVYSAPIKNENAVHSLEHGAVWVTYRPDLPQQQVDTLVKQATTNSYELLSPYPGLPSPVVASAWGRQLSLDSPDDLRLAVFLQAYQKGKQAPEPGAACSGGLQG